MKFGLLCLLLLQSATVLAQTDVASVDQASPPVQQVNGSESEPNQQAAPEGSLLLRGITDFLRNPINLILLSAILFMFMVVRPQQNQAKEQQKALAGLKKNDRVVTASGVHGIVVQANSGENVVVIRIDENSGARMTVNRDTISQIVNQENKE